MHQPEDRPLPEAVETNTTKTAVPQMEITILPRRTKATEQESGKKRPGGFVFKGKDRLNRELLTTTAGTTALYIFKKLGDFKPVYLSDGFFASIEC